MPRKKNFNPDIVQEKAMYLFWENGYKATSLRMLEKEMGINQFSIYSTFQSKINLFIQSLRLYRQTVRKNFLNILIDSKGNLQDIEIFMNRFVDSVKSNKNPAGCLVANTAAEFGDSNKRVKDELLDYYHMLQDLFSAVLIKAKTKGEFPETRSIDNTAKYLVTATQGMAVTAKIMSENDMSIYIKSIIEFLRKP